MICLFIDTSYHNLIIGLYKGLKEIYYCIQKNDNQLSTCLLPLLEEALKSTNLKASDIDKIFVVNGPGSFTGIRIGVATAKTLGWSLSKDIVPISEIELLATTKTEKKYVLPMIDARRGFVYSGLYDTNLKALQKDKYIKVETILKKVYQKYNSDDVEIVSFDEFDNINVQKPKVRVEKIIEKYIDKKGREAHRVNPNYLKKTEAEEKKKH